MEGPERCFSGTVTLPDSISSISELPHSLLPLDTCQSEQGICFTALTQSQGVHVASFGCWPTQSNGDFSIAWYGVPECKNEVNRLICLCVTSLCNKFLPKSEIDNPEFEDPQAFIIIGLIVLIIVLISCASSKFLFKFCKKLISSDKNSLVTKDCEKGGYGVDNVLYHVFQDYPPPPPSVKRMNSAPAAMTGGTKNTDIGVRFINVKASFPAKIKESLTSLEKLNVSKIKPKPITRIETEV